MDCTPTKHQRGSRGHFEIKFHGDGPSEEEGRPIGKTSLKPKERKVKRKIGGIESSIKFLIERAMMERVKREEIEIRRKRDRQQGKKSGMVSLSR